MESYFLNISIRINWLLLKINHELDWSFRFWEFELLRGPAYDCLNLALIVSSVTCCYSIFTLFTRHKAILSRLSIYVLLVWLFVRLHWMECPLAILTVFSLLPSILFLIFWKIVGLVWSYAAQQIALRLHISLLLFNHLWVTMKLSIAFELKLAFTFVHKSCCSIFRSCRLDG